MRVRPLGFTLILLTAGLAVAQPAPTPSPPPTPPPPAPARPPVKSEDLPPAARLARRVENARRVMSVIPTVVIVPDAASYAAAISRWNLDPRPGEARSIGARFPVLIDDGSWRAREDIARFVRAFEPRSVVRWSVAADHAPWPKNEADARAAIEASAYASWGGAKTFEAATRLWKQKDFAPPGVVAASPNDPAWTAALALAAGHGQFIAWVKPVADPNSPLPVEEARTINDSIMQACAASGFAYGDLGDEVEAVTLCIDLPVAVKLVPQDPRKLLATTDVIGRGAGGDAERRWAWAGQIHGSEARAAYMAMCALFIQPERAWLFDGYAAAPNSTNDPKSQWDATTAAGVFGKVPNPLDVILNDTGSQGLADWRNRASGMGLAINSDPKRETASGIDAGFIAVNTSGHPEQFDLSPGQARAVDVPWLHVPAAVHFVHSFSAARPGSRATIAGRFLERGAFAYVGAVDEPYLQAFIPTPLMVARMLAAGPWGVSVRLDDAPTWKIAVFGDPLWTMGPRTTRLDDPLPLENATPLLDTLADALRAKQFDDAVWSLVLQGRDEDASRLVRLIDKDESASLSPNVAAAGVMAVFRSPGRENAVGSGERLSLLARLCVMLEDRYPQTPELRDIMWHAAYPLMDQLTPDQARALAGAVRPEAPERDARELVRAARATIGAETAATVVRAVLPNAPDSGVRNALDRALNTP